MASVIRYDIGTFRKPRRTDSGALIVDGFASRTGIQEYRNGSGGIRRELRLPEDVFHQDSLTGFEGAPITEDHPSDMVDIKTLPHVQKGVILSTGRKDDDHVAVSFVVTDPGLIRKMESGEKRQLSVGYKVDLDETPGEHPLYGRYDAIQRKIVPNHLAVLSAGRAGPTACARMDSAYQVTDDDDTVETVELRADFDPDEPRGEDGKWGAGGSGGGEEHPDKTKDLGRTGAPGESERRAAAADKATVHAAKSGAINEHLGAAAAHTAAAASYRAEGKDAEATKHELTAHGHQKAADEREKTAAKSSKPQTKTTPFSGYTRAQITPALVEQARKIAAKNGDKQFGFRDSKTASFHTVIATKGGTLRNPDASAWGAPTRKDHAACQHANDMPKYDNIDDDASQQEPTVNLEQALAALAAANEKLGAERSRADAAVTDLEAIKVDVAKWKVRKDAHDLAVEAVKTAEAALAAAKGEVANLTTNLENANKARTDAAEQYKADVKSRVALESQVNSILGATDKDGKPVDRSDKSDKVLKIEVIKHVDGKDVAETEHEQFVQALFLGAIERNAKSASSVAAVRQTVTGARADGSAPVIVAPVLGSDEKAAAAALRDQVGNAWTRSTTTTKKDGE